MKSSSLLEPGVFLVVSLVFSTGISSGVVLHPDGEPNMASWHDHPPSSMVGRWFYGGSCVVVSSNCVVTTMHQGGGIGTSVKIEGKLYRVDRVWDHSQADLRVARLADAAFTVYADIYEGRDEPGKEIVTAGFGYGRGDELRSQSRTYGYGWAEGSYGVLRMGTNRIESTANGVQLDLYVSDVIKADFDGPGAGLGTPYEAATASLDSGGGWFIESDGVWKVAGLARGIESHYENGHDNDPNFLLSESWFARRDRPLSAYPDQMDAVRLSSYADWIRATLCGARSGDLDCSESVDIADLALLAAHWGDDDCDAFGGCEGADVDGDGDVDHLDMAILSRFWLGYGPPEGS